MTQPEHNDEVRPTDGGVDRRIGGDCPDQAERVDRDPGRIEAMFAAIAPRYDLMNRLMTAGDSALDVCCGTGDLAFALADACADCAVTGLDFTAAMVERAREKATRRRWKAAKRRWQATRRGRAEDRNEDHPIEPTFVCGDLLALPFADGEFAAVTVGWGVRNVPDLDHALAEMRRVTRPGGRVVILESTRPPDGLGRRFHAVWFDRLVPRLGRLVAGAGSAYEYLPASVRDFPDADGLAARMAGAGLVNVRYRRFGFGAVALHVAEVPG